MKENVVLMCEAVKSLQGKWKTAIAATAILLPKLFIELFELFIPSDVLVLTTLLFDGGMVLLEGAICFGYATLWLSCARNQEMKVKQICEGFRYFGSTFLVFILILLLIIFWVLLLFIVPIGVAIIILQNYTILKLSSITIYFLMIIGGIVGATTIGVRYSMIFYIMVDNPHVRARQIITKSKIMMYGYKWKLFCLYIRFWKWMLVSILNFGIGFLWLIPYINVAHAKFYDDIKHNNQDKQLQ